MKKTCCVNGLFCWDESEFAAWEDILDFRKPFGILPYRGWTPPMLVGSKKRYVEVWQQGIPRSNLVRVWNQDDRFHIGCGGNPIKSFNKLDDAVNELFIMNNDLEPFQPEAVYRKGEGQLEHMLKDPESVAIIVSTWKRYRRKGNAFHAVASKDNCSSAMLFWPHSVDLRDAAWRKDQRQRETSAQFKYKTQTIGLRCGGKLAGQVGPGCDYTLIDYKHDGWCVVLNTECHSEAAIEFFKNNMLKLAGRLDIDAVFVKEKKRCYALGCQEEEFYAQAEEGLNLHIIKNIREEIPLENHDPLPALFEFLNKLHNFSYVHADISANLPVADVPFIEEEIRRDDVKRCGSFMGAVRFYQEAMPIRRSQWNRIQNPLKQND